MKLEFGNRTFEPNTRTLNDMLPVLLDRIKLGKSEEILYYMFTDVSRNEAEHSRMVEASLRYDITVILPKNLGREYVKTLGHYHPQILGTDLSYPELYQVLEGEAHFILQRLEKGRVADAVAVKALKGQCVLIPPNYGHVTVNPTGRQIRIANWVFRDFASVYKDYKDKHGAAYYELSDGKFIENESYTRLPKLRFSNPVDKKLIGLGKNDDMYVLVEDLTRLEFLKKPQDYGGLFEKTLN